MQLGLGLIAAPVGTGHAFELEGLGIEFAGVGHVGACAEIPPLVAEGVEGDRFLQALQDFQLVGLVLGPDLGFGLPAGHRDALQGQAAANDLAHLFFDGLEIGFGERIRVVEVVVEAVLGPGTNGDPGRWKQLLDRHGHHMAHGVADLEQLRALAGFGQGDRSRLGAGNGRGHGSAGTGGNRSYAGPLGLEPWL